MAEAKLTEQQKDEIIEKFFEDGVRQVDLAKEYGVAQSTISHVINDGAMLEKMLKRTTANRVRAQIRVNRHLEEAVDTQIELMRGEYEDQYKFLKQNAARDILDRGGVRMEKEEKPETRVVIDFGDSGGVDLGVPNHAADRFEEDELPEEDGG